MTDWAEAELGAYDDPREVNRMSWDCPPGAKGKPGGEKDVLVLKKIGEAMRQNPDMSFAEKWTAIGRAFHEVYSEEESDRGEEQLTTAPGSR